MEKSSKQGQNTANSEEKSLVALKAEEYLAAHFHEKIRLQNVAQELGVSSSYLSMAFSRDMGETFIDCLNRLRVEEACRLLRERRMKTYLIAYQVGYTDEKYFSRVFRKIMNMSPSEYKRKIWLEEHQRPMM